MSESFSSGVRMTSSKLILMALRVFSAAVLGLTIGLATQEILGQGAEITIAFAFSFFVAAGIFWRGTKNWGFSGVLVLDLALVLIGVLLKLYVIVAPGA